MFDTFSQIFKNTICSNKFHINDLEAVVQCYLRRIAMRIFSMFKKAMIFITFNDSNNFMVLGPRPLGPMGPFVLLTFFENLFYGLGPI